MLSKYDKNKRKSLGNPYKYEQMSSDDFVKLIHSLIHFKMYKK